VFNVPPDGPVWKSGEGGEPRGRSERSFANEPRPWNKLKRRAAVGEAWTPFFYKRADRHQMLNTGL
jgi:hypothetical protein